MSDATKSVPLEYELTDKPALPLGAGIKAIQGTKACQDTAAGCIKPFAAGNANLKPIGRFLETTDNSASSSVTNVVVQLDRPVRIDYWANDTVSAVTQVFSTAYGLDNQTVTAASSGNSPAGTVWKINAKGVGVVTPAF